MNFFKVVSCVTAFLALYGCQNTQVKPHTFVNTYTEETLPDLSIASNGDYTINGSSFLRQNGGMIVNCAGNKVVLKRSNKDFKRDPYYTELFQLNSEVMFATPIDPRLREFNAKLHQHTKDNSLVATCDIDGKFTFKNVPFGEYEIITKVIWGGFNDYSYEGGVMSKEISIPKNSPEKIIPVILNSNVVRKCMKGSECEVY